MEFKPRFFLYAKDTFCVIEVKNTENVYPKMLKGLPAFQKDYPEADTGYVFI